MLRVSRVLHVARMVRLVRLVSALRGLIFAILHSLRSAFWALLLIVLIFYGCGIIFATGVSDLLANRPQGVPAEVREVLGIHWGSLPRAMFTLFKSTSGGINWHDV